METTRTDRFKTAILLIAATGLIAGLAFHLSGRTETASLVWIAGSFPRWRSIGAFQQELLEDAVIPDELRFAPHEPATLKLKAVSDGQIDFVQGNTT
ncbi:hypothetical protein GCM10007908_21350 [Rhizobium albus]|nr:hypothetical protein GCM10007908_21350 [Rhizobium albus]